MKIKEVSANNRRKAFEVRTASERFWIPYSKCAPGPEISDRVVSVFPDDELGREAFTYVLASGQEGSVHLDAVLEYNEDPRHLRDLLLYKLSLEAQQRLEHTPLSRREIIRRLGTSASQFYRLIDQTNYKKSIDQLISLLWILDCEVDVVVAPRPGQSSTP